MSIEGKWNAEIDTPMGRLHAVMILDPVEQNVVTGTVSWNGRDHRIYNGTFDGTTLSWTVRVTQPVRLQMKFTGSVDGDSITGKAKPGMFPASKVVAARP